MRNLHVVGKNYCNILNQIIVGMTTFRSTVKIILRNTQLLKNNHAFMPLLVSMHTGNLGLLTFLLFP